MNVPGEHTASMSICMSVFFPLFVCLARELVRREPKCCFWCMQFESDNQVTTFSDWYHRMSCPTQCPAMAWLINETKSWVACGVTLLYALIIGFAVVLHQPFALFPLQSSFFHLLRLCSSSSITGWNNDPTVFFWDLCFLCEMKILILSLPLHNALTIHSPLSACEATLQGN